MDIITDAELIRAYRQGRYHVLPGPTSSLGDACSQCGQRVKAGEDAVLANDAMGWQLAHPRCVGTNVVPVAELSVEPTSLDYGKGAAPYRAALVAELEHQDTAIGIPGHTLRRIARSHIERALDSDATATRELADRLDGKPGIQDAQAGMLMPLYAIPIEQLRRLVAEHAGNTIEGEVKQVAWHQRKLDKT